MNLQQLEEALLAERTKNRCMAEIALRLYRRFGESDQDVMELWSMAVLAADQRPTEKDIARARELFPHLVVSAPPLAAPEPPAPEP